MEKEKFVRGLKLHSGVALIAGAMIGSAIFLLPAEITQHVPDPWLAISVWVVAGLISMLGGLTFAELGAALPGAGGLYLYLREAFSPLLGFLYGWALVLVIQPGSIAGVAVAFAHFLAYLVPLSSLQLKAVATLVIVGFTVLNMRGVEGGAKAADIFTFLKAVALVGIGVAGFVLLAPHPIHAPDFRHFQASPYGLALVAAFFGYDGWANLCFVAAEVERPQRNVPLGIILGIALVTTLYTIANVAYYRFLPVAELAQSHFPAAEAAKVMGGGLGVTAVILSVLISTLGCVNSLTLGGARVTYAMADDGALPRHLAFIHPKFHVPSNALLMQMIVALLLAWSGSYGSLVTCVIAVEFVFYALGALAVIVLRRTQPDIARPYRVPLYPFVPMLYIFFNVLFLGNVIFGRPLAALGGVGIVLLGVPFFYYMKRRGT